MSETAEHNGTAAPAEAVEEESPLSERLLGIFGLAFGLGILLIGVDLVSGGALSRLFTPGGSDGD